MSNITYIINLSDPNSQANVIKAVAGAMRVNFHAIPRPQKLPRWQKLFVAQSQEFFPHLIDVPMMFHAPAF